MEVDAKSSLTDRLKNLVFKEKVYFLNRREIDWATLSKCGATALAICIVGVLLIPAPEERAGDFHEEAALGARPSLAPSSDPTAEATSQIDLGHGFARSTPSDLSHLYAQTYVGVSGGIGSSGGDRSQSMILARSGIDSKTQLPPGSRIAVRLFEKAIVANQGMPVIGVVLRDYVHEDSLALPQGTKLFGDITFADRGDRANISWKSVQLPDGREREFSAIGVGSDGQVGVSGRIRSEALKNTLGQTLTRFIGAYAEGSMQREAFGGNPGGSDNGWKNAISGTANDQADRWANDLQKEKRWIEVSNQTEFYAVLTAKFAFRDPGNIYE